jgi:phospholipid-binding lipoprotein MlaA
MARLRALPLLALAALLGACSTAGGPDPWRGLNTKTFAFNEEVDQHAVEPVARGWDWAMPDFVQEGVGNFFDNLLTPRTIVNDALQGKAKDTAQDFLRFALNSTIGLGGILDVATPVGLPYDVEDFGQTLGRWGVEPGPYFVIPFFGPSSVRDTAAWPLDIAANPTLWVEAIPWGFSAIGFVNLRADYLDEIEAERESAVDYYVFVRDAWLQNREKLVRDAAEKTEEVEEDLYQLEEFP